jgi:transposase
MNNCSTFYVGIDLHREQSTIAIMDQEGVVVKEGVFNNDPDKILNFLKICPSGTEVGLEATRNWHWLYDLLIESEYDARLGNPYKLKANIAAKKKTDKLDARMLANFLRVDMFPNAHAAVGYQRDLLEQLRLRDTLVKHRTQLKNRIHAQIGKHNLRFKKSALFTQKGIEWLREQEMPKTSHDIVGSCLKLLHE